MKLVRTLFILLSFLTAASAYALEIIPYTPAGLA